jgi:hypothetical protein
MPTVTTILMVAGTAYQAVQAINDKAEADKGIAQAAMNAERISQGGVNKLASLKVPTLGTEIAQQNIQSRQQADIQALKEGGAATVLGGMTQRENIARQQDLDIMSNVDQMAYNRDLAVAQQEQQIADTRLNRDYALEMSRLTGAQTASAANQAAINQSIGGAVQIAGDVATMGAYKGNDPYKLWGEKNALFKTDPVASAVRRAGRDVNKFGATINTIPGGLIG